MQNTPASNLSRLPRRDSHRVGQVWKDGHPQGHPILGTRDTARTLAAVQESLRRSSLAWVEDLGCGEQYLLFTIFGSAG
jgi:hypothetical protein